MKALALAMLAILALAFQVEPGPSAVVVLVDTDGPVADPVAAAHLREHVLGDLDLHTDPLYYDLRATTLSLVSTDARDSFRRTIFTFEPPSYGGISVSFVEATEIFRKNEAVRDSVIRRECARVRLDSCGGAVHQAAMLVLAETETTSGRKLQSIADVASRHPRGTLVLVTAGWPYRDEERLGFDHVLAQIRAAAVRIVVLRTPSAVRYGGLVKDASETLTSSLQATWVELSGDKDISRTRAALAHLYPAELLPTKPLHISGVIGLGDINQGSEAATVDEVVERAVAYVGRFEREFSSIIWRERYAQEDRVRRQFKASGASFWTLANRRVLESELLFVWLPVDASWIAVRDVIAVDGKVVPVDRRRLPPLLAAPSISVSQLRRLASENGRFNVGRIVHTFNEPTLALLFLDDNYRHRFRFARRGERPGEQHNRVEIYEFLEHATPTVIRDGDRDVPVRGTFWIDPDTGSVLRTILEVLNPPARLQGRMTVEYGRHPRFEVLVPIQMQETYSSPDEQVTAHATYSDFKRFETGARLIAPK